MSKVVTRSIALVLAASILATLDSGQFASWLALVPSRILRGELWRLVTWPLIESGPINVAVTCIVIYKLGGDLAVRWGDRRLLRFLVAVVLAAGIGTSVLALIFRSHVFILGGWALDNALMIAWARQFPHSPLRLYGLLVLRGRELVQLTVAVAVLFAIFYGPIWSAPELIACAVALMLA